MDIVVIWSNLSLRATSHEAIDYSGLIWAVIFSLDTVAYISMPTFIIPNQKISIEM